MKVTIFILDDPSSKYDWVKITKTVDTLEDIEKITGHCHKRMYCYMHDFTGNESEELKQIVNDHYIKMYNSNLTETMDWLFKLISYGIEKEKLLKKGEAK